MKSKLFEEAIADAKAAQSAAMANAKHMMEEVFSPRLKEMLSAKLKEELEEGDPVEPVVANEAEEMVTSEEINRILAELDGELKGAGNQHDAATDEEDSDEAPVADAPAAPVADAPAAPEIGRAHV